ncbi:hypothetical protein HPB50_007143 [Hyalomma asiaticum]|uniref:Uncharacterized protein n=1 Tax=Hyalomma asiaticum TaxID=266040 RepID=A0ACB7TDQ5_HYAAI|nr:hypothetical protein HPB50_007143 [Hyalomma asiaticum]
MVQSQREIVLTFMEQYPELAQKASELQHGLTLALNAQDPVTKLRHSGRTGGKKKYTKPATMPSPKLKGERPNGMGNSSFDIGICVSRFTGGGRAPGFRGRILRVTGASRVGGLRVGTLYQELGQRLLIREEIVVHVVILDNSSLQLRVVRLTRLHHDSSFKILRRIVQLLSSIVVLAHKEAAARERAAAQEGIMSELHSLAQTMALQQERN